VAGEDRTASHVVALLAALQREPHRFDFYEAVRRLECAYPDRPRLGRSVRAREDPIRLGQTPSLAFAPSSLDSFDPGREGRPPRLSVLFFGLFGPNGPLPLHLTEYVRQRGRLLGDRAFSRFADIFHHRMLSLFYRAWADARPTVQFDRPGSDRCAVYVGALLGMALPSLLHRDKLSDSTRLHYVGPLSMQTRHAEGLAGIVADFFKTAADVDQFVGQWIDLPVRGRLRLGESPETGRLGRTTTIGARVWDRQQKFRLIMGPMSLGEYRRLLPDGEALGRLASLVRTYVGDELAWEVNLVLKKEEIPPLVLGGTAQVGWTSWLANRRFTEHVNDLYLDPLARGDTHV
jgi:type VI secretion system protein ImpH